MQKTGSVELGDVSHDFNFCFVLFCLTYLDAEYIHVSLA